VSEPVVFYLGGNGHATDRLTPTRRAVRELSAAGEVSPFQIVEAAYPGFEDRPSAPDFDAFVDVLLGQAQALKPRLALGTGIGGLILLCLRSLGGLAQTPVYLHAPVLWGLERRWMPRLVRLGPLRRLLPPLFAARWYQRRFVKKQFVTELDEAAAASFFDGYARCSAFGDLFDWLRPALLRQLEQRFEAHREQLEHITVWWGSRDRVVTPAELTITLDRLGVQWPLVMFDDWAHYPMMEAPHSFARALDAALQSVAQPKTHPSADS
jgi:pimeloyl-ACP methyl ester carboxylesterase